MGGGGEGGVSRSIETHHNDLELCLLPLPALEHVALDVHLVQGGVHHDALHQEAVLAQPQVVVVVRCALKYTRTRRVVPAPRFPRADTPQIGPSLLSASRICW